MNEDGNFSFENAPVILGNYGHALGMSGETEKGVAFTCLALNVNLIKKLSTSKYQKVISKIVRFSNLR